jgi:hypothetical protein
MPEVALKFVKPDYEKLQINQIDYTFEQVWFDYLGLAEKLKNSLDK